MTKLSFVTPINHSQIRHLSFSEYILLYLDKDDKLKRAIPDFEQKFIDEDSSLINEATEAERFAFFRLVKAKEIIPSPVFSIFVEDDGYVLNCDYNSLYGEERKIDDYLVDSKKAKNMVKKLKKNR